MFTKLKSKASGRSVRVALSKVTVIEDLGKGEGTELIFDNGVTLVVSDSFQTVSNRANDSGVSPELDSEPAPAPVA